MTCLSNAAVFAAVIGIPLSAVAGDCWTAKDLKGYSAIADQGYKFTEDGITGPIVICFTDKGGIISGTDVQFVKFGDSTLAGYGGNNQGNELLEVYQIDRTEKKLLYMKSRIGTKTVVPVLSDIIAAFVGDAVQAQ